MTNFDFKLSNLSINLKSTNGGVGCFVEGLSLRERLSRKEVHCLIQALGKYGVLFFRDQDISKSQHVALAQQFGNIVINRFFQHLNEYSEIAIVNKEPEQNSNIGGSWHTDHSYDKKPAMGSIVIAREIPNTGGDTIFANMYTAYETLSDGLKSALDGLEAIHSSRHVFGSTSSYLQKGSDLKDRLSNTQVATQDTIHPVIIEHPISKRKALYINPTFTVRFNKWSKNESRPLLNLLYEHAKKPEHCYRFNWTANSVVFWDNRSTWHYALNDYHGERRVLHRVTIAGKKLRAGKIK